MEHEIRVGPAGWSYDDWKGIVYPARTPSKFDQLAYIAEFFNTIEINSSFYRPPSAQASSSWARRVAHNKHFKFSAKLYQKFTHDRGQATREDEASYRGGIDPLMTAGKLGALLLQFPWSFKNTETDREYLDGLIEKFKDYPLVVELRHASWNQAEIYQWLESHQVGFCNIDQPLFARSIKPSARATSRVGYVRLHGRNYESWFSDLGNRPEDRAERYNYLYSPEELAPWIERIEDVARQASNTYVITNNHFQGKGVVNGLEIRSRLEGKKLPGPVTLIAEYPRIQESIVPVDSFQF
jgi:uncharacterized protein YecE (DUF72 family)